jgi:hypothetical protein
MGDPEVWECERRLWLDCDSFYREHVAPDALFVLPLVGLVDRAAALAAASKAPRWTQLSFSRQRSNLASPDTAVLAYDAHAETASSAHAYHACCSSTYVRMRRSWMLVAHQQSAFAAFAEPLCERSALSLFFAD